MAEASATFSESWHRIAARRVYLRPDVRIQRQRYRGERWFVLQNPFSAQYYRLRPAAYEFIGRLSSKRTVQEVWQECVERFPDEAPGQEAVLQLLAQLYHANLLHYDEPADSALLFQRFQQRRQREISARLMNLMFMRIPLLDPDTFLKRTLPVVGLLISRAGVLLWCVVVGMGLKVVADHFAALRIQGQGVLDAANLPLLYLALILLKGVHEFGHAYFCRKFGGEVHVMGLLLMIFTPVPYMDATSSWGFRERWKRILVGAAGMIVELYVAACATFVWAGTGPGTLHSIAYNMMFIASVSTLAFNANPLLRFDGYYMLSDWLEIPNLAQRAQSEMQRLWERWVFGVKEAGRVPVTARESAWLVFYGVASGIYRVVVFSGVLLLVADRFLILGVLMAIFCAVSWIAAPCVRLVRYLATSPRLARVRTRATLVTASLAGALVVLLAVVPFPHHFRAPGVARASACAEVVNDVRGVVTQILAPPGIAVARGQPLVRMSNPQLDLELAEARAARAEVEARARAALSETNADLKPLASRLESVSHLVAKLEANEAALTIVAPHAGLWISPHLADFRGRLVDRGTPLGLVVPGDSFEFVASIAQTDADAAFAQRPRTGEVRFRGEASAMVRVSDWTIVPGGTEILPSPALGQVGGGQIPVSRTDPRLAAEPFFEIHARLIPSAGTVFLHGRSGVIRFELQPEPLLPRWLRRLQQLLQRRYKV